MAVAFFAYPDGINPIKDAITHAAESSKGGDLELVPWANLGILGFKLDDLIREQVTDKDLLIADITRPNHNVLYEMGYAIAVGKPVLPTVNVALQGAVEGVQKVGLFDNTGWLTYENGDELKDRLSLWNDVSWRNRYSRKRDHTQPLFILDTLRKTDFRNHIFHAVENEGVQYRKFDPTEIPRLTAAQALADVSASAGVLLPMISTDIVDFELHNLRAAFLLGLSHGFQIEALAIQYEHGPAPLDYRDFITNSTFKRETEGHVAEYCAKVLIWNQQAPQSRETGTGLLGRIDLGSPAAENEGHNLGSYFIRTAEFSRALRAEGAVVAGRKGSGKSAVFLQVVEQERRNRATCIVDLRPASHSLSEMREALLGIATQGIFDHTIAAFWQYVVYVEILLKIREMVLPRSRNDFELQERIREIEKTFALNESVVSGDFTSRLSAAVREVISVSRRVTSGAELRGVLTNLMFEEPLPRLRDAIASFRDSFDEIVFLIDDLDKGWPPRQVEAHDVSTIRHLIEVLNQVRRDLDRKKVGFRHLVFLRSDIYEMLVQESSDRGKYNVIRVDWSDAEQLRHLLRQRVASAVDPAFEEAAWVAMNPNIKASDAVGLMIENSLRRPRFLIDLCERVVSCAINRGHASVTEADVDEGMRQMSLYLVSDFGYEMRDVAGTPESIFYKFIGSSDYLTEDELQQHLSDDELGLGVPETINLLLWYGFLGVVAENGQPIFIYDTGYDFRRLEAERPSDRTEALYAVNTAFIRGLARGASNEVAIASEG